MRKSWITIELKDGRKVKYVNKNPLNGVPYQYYCWGLTAADSLLIQGDTSGKVLYDYRYLTTSWLRATADNTELFLIFPERADTKLPSTVGPTGDSLLIRPDYSTSTVGYAFELQSKPYWGDTGITRLPAMSYEKYSIHGIETITIMDKAFVGDTWKHY